MTLSEHWKPFELCDGQWVKRGFGNLEFLLLNHHEEWRVARLPDGSGLPADGSVRDLPDDLSWERWDHDPKDTRITLRPTFPTMPVVARPHSLLNLSPKGEATFFIGVPAWIEVLGECQGDMLPLAALPTSELSKTWHGTPLAGRLGFALPTFARRVFEPDQWPRFEILCPISIVNENNGTLPFERLFLETDHLTVFEKDRRLWSNAARIRVSGGQKNLNNITYATRPHAPYEDAIEVTAPRKGKVRRSTFTSTFTKVLDHFNPLDDPS